MASFLFVGQRFSLERSSVLHVLLLMSVCFKTMQGSSHYSITLEWVLLAGHRPVCAYRCSVHPPSRPQIAVQHLLPKRADRGTVDAQISNELSLSSSPCLPPITTCLHINTAKLDKVVVISYHSAVMNYSSKNGQTEQGLVAFNLSQPLWTDLATFNRYPYLEWLSNSR